jgi:hypothetical protein
VARHVDVFARASVPVGPTQACRSPI